MEADLISQGIDLMLFGMGTVFVFLTVLVGSTSVMSAAVNRFFPEETNLAVNQTTTLRKPSGRSTPVDARTLIVIQEAIRKHRASTSR